MAKTLIETPITTPNARERLSPGLYWRRLDSEVHLGYRKGRRAGTWLVRWRAGKGYKQAPLGPADDAIKEGTLSFSKAEIAARKHVEQARIEEKALKDGPPLTVRRAVEEYTAMRDARLSSRTGRPIKTDASHRLGRHILGAKAVGSREATDAAPLADAFLHKLTEADLRKWRQGLPNTLKPTTVKRLAADLKAALNNAAEAHKDRLPPTLPLIVKDGLKFLPNEFEAVEVARENQVLSDAQVTTLLQAAQDVDNEQAMEGDLYRLVLVLAATGARFSQISRLRVVDFQVDQRRLMVPWSRKGKQTKSGYVAVPVGQDVLEALLPITVGRDPSEPLLLRPRFKRTNKFSEWERSHRGPWEFAYELTPFWGPIRDKAKMPEVVPYALRHSSIVRGIRANLPIRLVAALHDTSVDMIERHYSRWISTGLDDLAAAAVVPLAPPSDDNVVTLRKGGSGQ